MDVSAENCAADLMDTVPMVMRFIRTEMRKQRGAELSVPQFRTLVFIDRHPETSLISVANHLGLTPPSASVLVDSLIERSFVDKRPSLDDRRKITLSLLEKGKRILGSAQKAAHERLAEKIKTTTSLERQTIHQAMEILRKTYSSESVR